jgi:hypothetical protein
MSLCVHTLPSLQGLSFAAAYWQPSLGSQLSVVHGFLSSQLKPPLPAHEPLLHPSTNVQMLLSLHGAVLFVVVHPSCGSHASSVHGLPSLHAWMLQPAH